MFDTMDINQLQEQYMELTGEARVACMRELARRFREGIGVDVDAEEAEAWEKDADDLALQLRGPGTVAQEMPKQQKKAAEAAPDLSGWDNASVYRAYREGDLNAAVQYAQRLSKAGENANALSVCLDLIEKLEADFYADPTGQLLPQAKLLCGKLYEQSKQLDKARLCYEEAACELDYRPAVLQLVRFYIGAGTKRYEKELKPLLDQLSTGNVEERLVAAGGYQQLGNAFEAGIHLQSVMADPDASSAQRFKAMRGLRSAGKLKQAELESLISKGDVLARLLQAQELAETGNLDEAENLLAQLELCGISLDNHNAQIRDNIRVQIGKERQRILDEQKRKAAEAEQRRIAAEAEQRRKAAEAEQQRRNQLIWEAQRQRQQEEAARRQQEEAARRQREEADRKQQEEAEKKARVRKFLRIPLAYAAVILLLIGGSLAFKVVELVTLKKIDVFEEIQVAVDGAAPYATVEVYSTSGDPFVSSIHFSANPESGLSSGDTVTITANISKDDAKKYGYRVSDTTMKYKLKDVPSYITDVSDLKKSDVEVLFAKIKRNIPNCSDKTLVLDSGETLAVMEHLVANMDRIDLLDTGYVSLQDDWWQTKACTIFTMKADLLDCEFHWYLDNKYYEEGIVRDFEDVYFYFVFDGLKLDSDGNLIQAGSVGIELSDVFESKDAMEQHMRDRYDDLVKGNVKN